MTDLSLQARAGLNVGNEPSVGNFIDKAGQSRATLTGNAEATLLEGIEENGRTALSVASTAPKFIAFNADPAAVGYETKYYNTFGESIATPGPDAGVGVTLLEVTGLTPLSGQPLVMVAGEKITAKRVVSQRAPGTADVTIFPSFRDLKIKPKPRGGGGLTDGNVARVRATITAQGVEIQPPPGKAWSPATYGQELDTADIVGHFGAVGDNPATIEVFLVDEDGVARSLGTSGPLSPQTFATINDFFIETNPVLAYPRKLRYKLVPGKLPIPVGRVLLMTAFTEFDQPR